ncbi:hypothetical protein KGF57_003861 [Candida theae]|uniref:Uncharacterized protein n=1 Tax=Candida theae TaxID=1198502 RepID=A0AAD5BD89_9ASCO|nr:uncharacterized protein KGF57_003861 [Candida theae]KAI5954837.1 hypothetical protein KGF57_003861 [Candida theae]
MSFTIWLTWLRELVQVTRFIWKPYNIKEAGEAAVKKFELELNISIFSVLTTTALDYRYELQWDADARKNWWRMERTTKFVLDAHEAATKLDALTYSSRMNISRFEEVVKKTIAVADDTGVEKNETRIISKIIDSITNSRDNQNSIHIKLSKKNDVLQLHSQWG